MSLTFKYHKTGNKHEAGQYKSFSVTTGYTFVKAQNGSWGIWIQFLGITLQITRDV